MERLPLDAKKVFTYFFFFNWIRVAGAPRTTSPQFSPVAKAYRDLCLIN